MNVDYPIKEIIQRARLGRKSIYPFKNAKFKFSIFGATIYQENKRFFTLDDIIITPPQFTPLRLKKAIELVNREPIYHDVETKSEIGGFKTSIPFIQSSMGSQDDWNIVSVYSAKACAKKGVIYGIGENVASTWGYDKRINDNQPCFIERILSYLDNCKEDLGGVVIQQNEEDAFDELWNKIYSDKRLDQYIQEGKIAFEIKAGQGAKAGLGGEKIVDRMTAKRLKDKYIIYPDPDSVDAEYYERHSSPDIFTEEILYNRIRKIKNDYPRVKVWLKTGPYRDLDCVIDIASKAGADCVVIDGKEGGTGMSPTIALQDLGLPALACLKKIYDARKRGITTSLVLSGRLYNGSHLVKAVGLGASGIAAGRAFLISSYAYPLSEKVISSNLYSNPIIRAIQKILRIPNEKSIQFISNYIETVEIETKMLVSAVGKYNIKDLKNEDFASFYKEIAQMFQIKYIYESEMIEKHFEKQLFDDFKNIYPNKS